MEVTRKPSWLNKKMEWTKLGDVKKILAGLQLNTVCEEAACPNISECFGRREATILILGNACTRRCAFCNIRKEKPLPPDDEEPLRAAQGVKKLALKHAVITSPTRDDLPDGGALHYKRTALEIKRLCPDTTVELLVPDFMGDKKSLETAADCTAEIIGHNMETVRRLYGIRKGADYDRSLFVLKTLKELNPSLKIKSGLMLGLGEKEDEVSALFDDLLKTGCRYLSIGQYLAPSLKHQRVSEYITPGKFGLYRQKAFEMGFLYVESSPYARSSYHSAQYMRHI